MSVPSPESCPFLPEVDEVLDHTVTRQHGTDRGPVYYRDALRFAQSQWLADKPAQAILQLDKAFMADLGPDDAWLAEDMDPWSAMAWMLDRIRESQSGFAGNPVRHFQHLASRMSGPRPEPRRWRAWVCLHLAERILPAGGFERDGPQIAREGLWIPGLRPSLAALARCGWPGEAGHVAEMPEIQGI